MPELVDILFLREWWRYSPTSSESYDAIYHTFNLIEGAAWLVCAAVVLRRWRKNRRGNLEIYYAAAFVAFGGTDFVEAQFVTSWLIWLKLLNLIALLWLRWKVIKRFYPGSKW